MRRITVEDKGVLKFGLGSFSLAGGRRKGPPADGPCA